MSRRRRAAIWRSEVLAYITPETSSVIDLPDTSLLPFPPDLEKKWAVTKVRNRGPKRDQSNSRQQYVCPGCVLALGGDNCSTTGARNCVTSSSAPTVCHRDCIGRPETEGPRCSDTSNVVNQKKSFDTAETRQRRDRCLNSLAALVSRPYDTV